MWYRGGMGRPTKYRADIHPAAVLSPACVAEGATWSAVAKACGVEPSTVRLWAERHEGFSAAIKEAKAAVDDAVEGSFFGKALGGDTTAGIFWLCNRRPESWRHVNRVEVTGAEGGPVAVEVVDARARLAALLDAEAEA